MIMTETIKETIDNVMSGCGVFIDFQKAFVTVNHSILIRKRLNIVILEEWVWTGSDHISQTGSNMYL